jgi:hypothetical protein
MFKSKTEYASFDFGQLVLEFGQLFQMEKEYKNTH